MIEDINLDEVSDEDLVKALNDEGLAFWEELRKACPRCGGASANPSNPSGRCSSCLKKLRTNKKKPGHYLHLHKLADDALRRQDGKTKTAKKKSSGRGGRQAIISKMKTAEKKTGQVMSPDRKDNGKGYSSSNTRAVPKNLNRGRHHVDEKKLANWRKRIKKSELTWDEFVTLFLAKVEAVDPDIAQAMRKSLGIDEE